MMLYKYCFVLFSLFGLYLCDNYLNTPIHECASCLCHAVSGCYELKNCARYSINMEYWLNSGSPTVNTQDNPLTQNSFNKCMGNHNCIVETIKKYTDINRKDCNCDAKFDCKDRLAIHLMGQNCDNPHFNRTRADRFNNCKKTKRSLGMDDMEEKEDDCTY